MASKRPSLPDSHAPRTQPPAGIPRRLLATQITGSRYVLHDLAPAPRANWSLALAGREECAPDYLVDRPSYPFHLVEVVASGKGWASFDHGPEEPIHRGAVYAYSPRTACRLRTDPEQPLVKFFFAMAGREVAQHMQSAALKVGTVRHLSAPAAVLAVAEDIIREGQRESPNSRAICLKLLDVLLLRIGEDPQPSSASTSEALNNFLRCKALIEERAPELHSLDEAAELLQLDASSICRLFRQFQGTSPYQFLLRRKMILAAELLIDTGCLVSTAAERVGFSDPFHFARIFKSVHGMSPSAVRQCRTGASVG